MNIAKCPSCPMLFKTNKGRRYCSPGCFKRAAEKRNADRLAEFKWIAGTDTWDNTAARLGFSTVGRLRDWLREMDERQWADRITDPLARPRQGQWAA